MDSQYYISIFVASSLLLALIIAKIKTGRRDGRKKVRNKKSRLRMRQLIVQAHDKDELKTKKKEDEAKPKVEGIPPVQA